MEEKQNKMIPHLHEAKKLIQEANEELLCANRRANPVEHLVLGYLLEDITQLGLRLRSFINATEERDDID
jgi:hypothetical protein